jgi:TonB family protein
MADGVPTTSSNSCELGEQLNTYGLSPEHLAASGALFMKMCAESRDALVNSDDKQLQHDLTAPGKLVRQHGLRDFYPRTAMNLGQEGAVVVAYIVETDGRVTWAVVLKSSGKPGLDEAAVEWTKSLVYESPAYLGFMPVRMYSVTHVNFRLR